MTLIDAAGTAHAPAGPQSRIVSLVPSITELVCELGLAHRLVGRTGFCIHPRDAVKPIPKLGGTKDVNLEALCALAPSHVIVNMDENRLGTAEEIRRFVPQLIVTHPSAPRDNLALYRLLGGIFDRADAAEALCARFETACARALAAARDFERESVLYLIWRDPWMTVSRDTYISRTLALAGWDTAPAAAVRRYPEITFDDPALAAVRTVLLSSEPYRFRERHLAELRRLPVMAGRRIALIDGEMTSWYGSRAIAGLDYLPGFRRSLEPSAT